MKYLSRALLISLVVVLAGCAVPVNPGDPETQVISRLGKPNATYQDGNERILEYDQGAFGQETHMARISQDGRLISYTQVLTLEQFAKIKIGQSKNDVLRLVGHPLDTVFYSRVKLEGWNYGFKESGVWNSLMTVYFDETGTVKKLENGPDPRFEHSRFGL